MLALRRPAQGRVFATEGGFRQATRLIAPAACRAAEGDCAAAVALFDGAERSSRADAADLGARETIDIAFDIASDAPAGERWGVVIAARQTLLSTYLFYRALAYMGTMASDFLAALERGDGATRERALGMRAALGGIEVLARDADGEWVVTGEIHETGPLATDVHLIDLAGRAPGAVRLRLTSGHWRIDWLALAQLGGAAAPRRIEPARVLRLEADGAEILDEAARQTLLDPARSLITLPGDAYALEFELPDDAEYELFLDSRGYYLEWMRREWITEQNTARAFMMLTDAARALRVLAPEYTAIEAQMDAVFWSSRYVRR